MSIVNNMLFSRLKLFWLRVSDLYIQEEGPLTSSRSTAPKLVSHAKPCPITWYTNKSSPENSVLLKPWFLTSFLTPSVHASQASFPTFHLPEPSIGSVKMSPGRVGARATTPGPVYVDSLISLPVNIFFMLNFILPDRTIDADMWTMAPETDLTFACGWSVMVRMELVSRWLIL